MNKMIAIYVPTTVSKNISAKMLAEEIKEMLFAKMIAIFGGATIIPAVGGYALENGDIVKENIFIVKSFCDEKTYNKQIAKVQALACLVCEKMSQECVAVESSDGMEFVKAPMKIAV